MHLLFLFFCMVRSAWEQSNGYNSLKCLDSWEFIVNDEDVNYKMKFEIITVLAKIIKIAKTVIDIL